MRTRSALWLLPWLAASAQAADPAPKLDVNLKALSSRSAPGAEHKALQPLVGKFKVEKQVFVAIGSAEKPATSSGMTTTREWVGDGRFVREVTSGKLGGSAYWREGMLGYNPANKRYEWNTADNVTPIMMQYRSKNGSAVSNPIEMSGAFTDLGVTGESNVGKPVMMRTTITVVDNDHHTFELRFTTPDGTELVADKMEFSRVK